MLRKRPEGGACIFGAGYTFASKVYVVGFIAFVVYALSAAVLKCSQHEKLWALPVFTTALFVLYPSVFAMFFEDFITYPLHR